MLRKGIDFDADHHFVFGDALLVQFGQGCNATSAYAGDGLIKEKGDLINSISLARDEAKKKGAKVVRYRDFFPRIGYAVKYDVNDESINQAAAKYLRTNAVPEGEPK